MGEWVGGRDHRAAWLGVAPSTFDVLSTHHHHLFNLHQDSVAAAAEATGSNKTRVGAAAEQARHGNFVFTGTGMGAEEEHAVLDHLVALNDLGKGASGVVSRAIHATQLELVAVKEIPSHDEASVRAVVSELKLLRTNAAMLEAVHGACRVSEGSTTPRRDTTRHAAQHGTKPHQAAPSRTKPHRTTAHPSPLTTRRTRMWWRCTGPTTTDGREWCAL